METRDIPDLHHVARYCSGSQHDEGKVLAVAFQLRSQAESYLSVNWLEYFGFETFGAALAQISADKRALGFSIRRTGRFALLNVESIRSIVQEAVGMPVTIHPLTIRHQPRPGDESHSGIGGYPQDDLSLLIADLLAESVGEDMLLKPSMP